MSPDREARSPRSPISLEVIRTEHLTAGLIRVVLGGDRFDEFVNNEFTDRYVKLVLPQPGIDHGEPFDLAAIRRERPREQWPRVRTYTVRRHDGAARELTIDFVHHGDEGVAGRWAAHASPGDLIRLLGPGGAYAPRSDVDWHLLVADEAALPATAAALEVMPAGTPVVARIEVAGPADEIPLETRADADIVWVHRGEARPNERLVDAVRGMEHRSGRVQAFVHGELASMQALKAHLLEERSIPAELLSISGYWRHGKDEDGFQAEKAALTRGQ